VLEETTWWDFFIDVANLGRLLELAKELSQSQETLGASKPDLLYSQRGVLGCLVLGDQDEELAHLDKGQGAELGQVVLDVLLSHALLSR
jgi:hypothetical protein